MKLIDNEDPEYKEQLRRELYARYEPPVLAKRAEVLQLLATQYGLQEELAQPSVLLHDLRLPGSPHTISIAKSYDSLNITYDSRISRTGTVDILHPPILLPRDRTSTHFTAFADKTMSDLRIEKFTQCTHGISRRGEHINPHEPSLAEMNTFTLFVNRNKPRFQRRHSAVETAAPTDSPFRGLVVNAEHSAENGELQTVTAYMNTDNSRTRFIWEIDYRGDSIYVATIEGDELSPIFDTSPQLTIHDKQLTVRCAFQYFNQRCMVHMPISTEFPIVDFLQNVDYSHMDSLLHVDNPNLGD